MQSKPEGYGDDFSAKSAGTVQRNSSKRNSRSRNLGGTFRAGDEENHDIVCFNSKTNILQAIIVRTEN